GRTKRDPDFAADLRSARRRPDRGRACRRAGPQGVQPAGAGLFGRGRRSGARGLVRVPPPIDSATLANLLEATGGDQSFVDELVDTYLAEGDRLIGDLVAAAEAGAVGDLVLPAHSLKSSSQNVGALELGELCRRLEEDARSGAVTGPVDGGEGIVRAVAAG